MNLRLYMSARFCLNSGSWFIQPAGEGGTYLVDFGVGKLYGLRIPYLNVIALLVLYGLGYVGYGVVQRMFQQVVSVIASLFPFHIISVGDVRVGALELTLNSSMDSV